VQRISVTVQPIQQALRATRELSQAEGGRLIRPRASARLLAAITAEAARTPDVHGARADSDETISILSRAQLSLDLHQGVVTLVVHRNDLAGATTYN
jgi:hypothetical protein